MLEYTSGHFTEHIDKQVNNETHFQVATQILIPPRNICSYDGGILKIRQEDHVVEVAPNDHEWTHIIIPIGLPHEITPVTGTRISYVRQILVEKRAEKDYPRQTNVPGIQTLTVITF